MTKKLKAKHEVFCREFLVDLNATQAATGIHIPLAQRPP